MKNTKKLPKIISLQIDKKPIIVKDKKKKKRSNLLYVSKNNTNDDKKKSKIMKILGISLNSLNNLSVDDWKLCLPTLTNNDISLADILKIRKQLREKPSPSLITPNIRLTPDIKQPNHQLKIENYSIVRELGNGCFGTTYIVKEFKPYSNRECFLPTIAVYNEYDNISPHSKWNQTYTFKQKLSTFYVLKRVLCNYNVIQLKNARKEARILAHIPPSQYVLTVFDFFQWNGDYCIVTNYCSGGTLFDHILSQKHHFPVDRILHILYDCLQGLHVLHSHNPCIVHRDLKPDNIFLSGYGHFVVGDMGLARLVKKDSMSYTSHIGYIAYRSPELIKTNKYTICSDIWCIGGILLSIMSKNPTYMEDYLKYHKKTLSESISQNYHNTITSIIEEIPYNEEDKKSIVFNILKICIGQHNNNNTSDLLQIIKDNSKNMFNK